MTDIRPAERRQLTVMLCDMVASTALSLRLDPEELADVIQAYRQRCADVVTAHGGVVARQIGDAVLAHQARADSFPLGARPSWPLHPRTRPMLSRSIPALPAGLDTSGA